MATKCIWCQDWDHQIYVLNGFVKIAAIRSGQPDLYTKAGGKDFKFCPWCGHKLHEVAGATGSETGGL